jgi:hypothetical protein
MDRRDMLRGLASGAALPLVGSLLPVELLAWGREMHASIDAGQSSAGTLAAPLMRTLTAASERTIPSDETPGAVAAGVPAFVEHMLSEWYDEPERARVISGLASLEALGASRHGQGFASCTEAQQDALLLELDREGPTHWFGTVKYLTIWGYFTSEIGVVRELGQWPSPGRYDGCAPYTPRKRA